MLPRPPMLTILNRFMFKAPLLVLAVALQAGCKPPGPKALLDGKRHLEKGRVEIAIERLQVATQLMPTNAHTWNYLGIACHQGGLASNAVVAYQRALQLDADLSEARINLGTLWLESGRVTEAKAEFTAYNLRRPNDPEGFKQLALAEWKGGELVAAEAHVRKALQLADRDAVSWNTLGLIQLQLDQPQAAAQSFEQALRCDERLVAARFNLAVVLHHQLKNHEAARRHYRHYVASKPRPADADAVEQVIAKLSEELALRPVPVAALPAPPVTPTVNKRGSASAVTVASPPPPASVKSVTSPKPVVASTPTPRPAAQPAPSVVNARSTAVQPQVNAGSVASEPAELQPAGRRDVTPLPGDRPRVRYDAEAIRSATETVVVVSQESKPGTAARRRAEEFSAKGQRAMQRRRYAEATDAFKAACDADAGWFQAHLNCSGAAIEAGRTSEAIFAARRALALQPGSTSARFNLALAQTQAGQWRDAAAQLEQVLARKPTDERALLTLANLCAEELAQPGKARDYYVKLLEINPGHPQAGSIQRWLKQNPVR